MPPTWWRRADVQVCMVSLVCFCCPGMFNAVTSMGGGIADQSIMSNSAAALYAVFVLSSLLAPAACASLGPRATLTAGTIGYIVYVAALAAYQHLPGNRGAAMVIFGGVVNGLSAGLLWTAQGQLIMAYPTRATKGRFLAVFWAIFNLGAVFGGLLTASTNWRHPGSGASLATYVAFLGVMASGSVLSILLAEPSSVVRPDGSLVGQQEEDDCDEGGVDVGSGAADQTRAHVSRRLDATEDQAVMDRSPGSSRTATECSGRNRPSLTLRKQLAEMRAVAATVREPLVASLLPLALYSNWFYTYQFSCFNHGLFTVRSQGVNNALYWFSQMAGAAALGRFLDGGGGERQGSQAPVAKSARERASASLAATSGLVLASWGAAAAVTGPAGGAGHGADELLDIMTGGWKYAEAMGVYLLWGISDSMVMVWVLWILGQNTDNLQTLARYAGLVKSVQALGSAVSWKLNSDDVGVSPTMQFWINVALAAIGLVFARRSVHSMASAAPISPGAPGGFTDQGGSATARKDTNDAMLAIEQGREYHSDPTRSGEEGSDEVQGLLQRF